MLSPENNTPAETQNLDFQAFMMKYKQTHRYHSYVRLYTPVKIYEIIDLLQFIDICLDYVKIIDFYRWVIYKIPCKLLIFKHLCSKLSNHTGILCLPSIHTGIYV